MFVVRLIVVLISTAFAASAQESLPRVLILGDSIYQQPARDAAKELRGKVEVVFPPIQPGEIRNTTAALENLDSLLGEKKWDLIHFNFGLGDLIHRAPEMKSFRVLPKSVGGVRATSAAQYEKNLNAIVKRLKATGAKLVWASTTPVRHSATDVFEKGAAIDYNAIAAKVMKTHQVPINDMHKYVSELIDMSKPAPHGFDPFYFDKKPIHQPIVDVIRRLLLGQSR